jgi:hypothetical protein
MPHAYNAVSFERLHSQNGRCMPLLMSSHALFPVTCPRSLAHRSRLSAFNVEGSTSAAEEAEDMEHAPPGAKTCMQRVRDWRFRPLGLEPSPELAAVAVGESAGQPRLQHAS